jgi:hypothetical protein
MARAGLWERAIQMVASAPSKFSNEDDPDGSPQKSLAYGVVGVAAEKRETHHWIWDTIKQIQNPRGRDRLFGFTIENYLPRNDFSEEALQLVKDHPEVNLNDSSLEYLALSFAKRKRYKWAIFVADMQKEARHKSETRMKIEVRSGNAAAAIALLDRVLTEESAAMEKIVDLHVKRRKAFDLNHLRHTLIDELGNAGLWEDAVAQADRFEEDDRDLAYNNIVGRMGLAGQIDKAILVATKISDPSKAEGELEFLAVAAAKRGEMPLAQRAMAKIESPKRKAVVQKEVAEAAKVSPGPLIPININENAIASDLSWVGLRVYCQ